MSGRLQVDPVDLLMSAEQLATLEREHTEAHSAANNTLSSAAAKWIGTSAAALQSKLGFLQQNSQHVGNELSHNSKAMRRIGTEFERTDETSAENILVTRQGR
ncbi:WXG100 family type VII secretion target [Mycobacteroides abscessus]|uniref:WXG100 family type VII secretion target n=1 Tax=Mycobacteroides abscessus TaxID=36809 RepID=UPI001F2D4F80|nr:WXG100 family type VII secretion target [Mycobacteroides abscessus]